MVYDATHLHRHMHHLLKHGPSPTASFPSLSVPLSTLEQIQSPSYQAELYTAITICTGYFLANSLEDLSASKKVPAPPFSFSRRDVCILFVTRTNSRGGHSKYHSCPLNQCLWTRWLPREQCGVSAANVCYSTAERASAVLQCR